LRHLVLVLADLYCASGDARSERQPDAIGSVAMPAFDELLRFATLHPNRIAWREWLRRVLDIAPQSPASIAAHACGAHATDGADAWLATPLSLEPRLDHVRVRDGGLLTLTEAEQTALVADFTQLFGPQLKLSIASARELLLHGLVARDVSTTDPARLQGADIRAHIPIGRDAALLRALASEIELWLHSHAINRHRRNRGALEISALWLWGGTADPRASSAAAVLAAPLGLKATASTLVATDAYSRGCAVSAGLSVISMANLEALDSAIVVLWPMSDGAAGGLAQVEAQWIAPANAALRAGRIDGLTVLVNDRLYTLRRRDHWRFWRRRSHWLDRLRTDPS